MKLDDELLGEGMVVFLRRLGRGSAPGVHGCSLPTLPSLALCGLIRDFATGILMVVETVEVVIRPRTVASDMGFWHNYMKVENTKS